MKRIQISSYLYILLIVLALYGSYQATLNAYDFYTNESIHTDNTGGDNTLMCVFRERVEPLDYKYLQIGVLVDGELHRGVCVINTDSKGSSIKIGHTTRPESKVPE